MTLQTVHPDQEAVTVAQALERYCPKVFKRMQTARRLGSLLSSTGKSEKSMWGSFPTLAESIRQRQEVCRTCDGTHCGQPTRGFYPIARQVGGTVTEAMRMCRFEVARRKQEKIHRLIDQAGIPPYLEGKTWDDYEIYSPEAKNVYRAAQKYAASSTRGGLYISGPKGTGKTFLAALIAGEKLRQGLPTLFVFVPDLLDSFRQAMHDGQGDDVARTAREADFLVLDDMGAERATAWVAEQLMALINFRYSHQMPTVITSNYQLDELSDHLSGTMGPREEQITGERICSRIAAMTISLRLSGQDMRLRIGG